jgi:hypothetical protein
MFEHLAVDRAHDPVSAEQHRPATEIGKSVIVPATDPNRIEPLETDIKPLQEVQFGAWYQAISIDENGVPLVVSDVTGQRSFREVSCHQQAQWWPMLSGSFGIPDEIAGGR